MEPTHTQILPPLPIGEAKVTELRAAYNAATVGSKEWRRIAEELDFWIGRKAEASR